MAGAGTIYTESTDQSLKAPRPAGTPPATNGSAELNLNCGKSGAADGFDRAPVMIFKLPDLGFVANPFGSASFSIFMNGNTLNTDVNADLYGLGLRELPDVQLKYYCGRSNLPDPTDATLLQDNFLTRAATINTFQTTSTDGNLALVAYLTFETDSETEPAQFTVAAETPGIITFGYFGPTELGCGVMNLAEDLLLTHNVLGSLILNSDIQELDGPRSLLQRSG